MLLLNSAIVKCEQLKVFTDGVYIAEKGYTRVSTKRAMPRWKGSRVYNRQFYVLLDYSLSFIK